MTTSIPRTTSSLINAITETIAKRGVNTAEYPFAIAHEWNRKRRCYEWTVYVEVRIGSLQFDRVNTSDDLADALRRIRSAVSQELERS